MNECHPLKLVDELYENLLLCSALLQPRVIWLMWTVPAASSKTAAKLKSEKEAEVKLLSACFNFIQHDAQSTKHTLFSDRTILPRFLPLIVTYILKGCDVRLWFFLPFWSEQQEGPSVWRMWGKIPLLCLFVMLFLCWCKLHLVLQGGQRSQTLVFSICCG